MSYDQFIVTIGLGNAGMIDQDDIARALVNLAERVADTTDDRGIVRDDNGNYCGLWELTPAPERTTYRLCTDCALLAVNNDTSHLDQYSDRYAEQRRGELLAATDFPLSVDTDTEQDNVSVFWCDGCAQQHYNSSAYTAQRADA